MDRSNAKREGYLREGYHYFHLRDTAGQERDFHFHDFDKLVLLLSGRVTYLVEDRRYELRPWDILLVRRHAIHKALIDVSEPYERIILYLDSGYIARSAPDAGLMDCFDRADAAGQHRIAPDGRDRERIAALLRQLEEALADTGFGASVIRDALLMQLLVLVGRAAPRDALDSGHTRRDEKLDQVLTYINEHPDAELTVEELASGLAYQVQEETPSGWTLVTETMEIAVSSLLSKPDILISCGTFMPRCVMALSAPTAVTSLMQSSASGSSSSAITRSYEDW